MSDLKIIDELLCDIKTSLQSRYPNTYYHWGRVYTHSQATRLAMDRLYDAFTNEKHPPEGYTLSLYNYFLERKQNG